VMAACFAVPGLILDGLAPHVWHGPNASEDWYRDVLAAAEHEGATDYLITLGKPLHVNVTGDTAYRRSSENDVQHTRQAGTQSGAIFTTALRKPVDGWRIAAWAWAKGTLAFALTRSSFWITNHKLDAVPRASSREPAWNPSITQRIPPVSPTPARSATPKSSSPGVLDVTRRYRPRVR
jgi:hypothetical protein